MEKNIKLKDFVDGYAECKDQDVYIENNLKVEDYIPYATKINEANRIVNATSYTSKKKIDDEGNEIVLPDKIRISSALRYAFTMHKIVELYTNIEMDVAHFVDEFDMINQSGLLEVILSQIGEKEKNEFNAVVQMNFDDFMANNYETHSFITNQIERVTDVLSIILKPVINKIESMNEKDVDKLAKSIDKLGRKFSVVK